MSPLLLRGATPTPSVPPGQGPQGVVRRLLATRGWLGGLSASVAIGPLLVSPGPLHGQTSSWTVIDYSVEFEIRNAGLPVRGTFSSLQAEIELDPVKVEAGSIRGWIDPSSVETGIRFRDRHLTGRQFFDVRRFPRVSMESIRIAGDADSGATGTFRLVIRDVERVVEIPFTFEVEGEEGRLEGALSIDRLEYGLGKPSPILADDVDIRVRLRLSRSGPPGP